MEVVLTVIVLSFWFLFPIGMFISVSHVDKNTDQVIRLGHLRHHAEPTEGEEAPKRIPVKVQKKTTWRPHVAHIQMRRWIRH